MKDHLLSSGLIRTYRWPGFGPYGAFNGYICARTESHP
jgi:hypothetical protein